jgi:transcriptional regulator with XRE-family HTH domain
MELGEKLLHLRATEGERRGFGRAMTQTEVATALRQELGLSLSQAYLSQIEGGKRVHLSNKSREALSRFFRVHPGYLVNDPPDSLPGSARLGHHSHQEHAPQASRAFHGIPGFALVPGLPGMPSMHVAATSTSTPLPMEQGHAAKRNGKDVADAGDWSEWTTWPGLGGQTGAAISRARLESLLSRLRDHPDAEHVLLVTEQALALSRHQLDILNEELARLVGRDDLRRPPQLPES